MYNERREKFTLRDVILQFLFVALFIFLLIWLFPTKSFINKKVNPLLDTIFNANVMAMKDAAKDYFTLPRLPQEVGDTVKLTLGEMLDKKLLLEFTDKYGKTCDVKESYVEVTKQDDEYLMKVNLKCSAQEDYILVHMGCYDYCSTTICEDKDDPIPTPTPTPKPTPKPEPKTYTCTYINGQYWGKNGTVVSKETYEKECTEKPITYTCRFVDGVYWGKNGTVVSKETYEKECISLEYEYLKVTEASCSDWSSWSDWSETPVAKTELVDVETKEETETKTETVIVGYRKITYYDKNAPIYETRKVFDGYEYKTVCTNWATEYEHTGTYKYSAWSVAGYQKFQTPPADNDTTRYSYDAGQTAACGDCGVGLYSIYKVETRTRAEVVNEKEVCKNWEEQKTEKYREVKVIVDYEKKTRLEPVYEEVTTTTTTTYYRYRTRTCSKATTDYKWSFYNDMALIKQGYSMTGQKRPIVK